MTTGVDRSNNPPLQLIACAACHNGLCIPLQDMKFDARYWQNRYKGENTPWDIGAPSPALLAFFSTIPSKNSTILIPGAGNGWEASWLWENGFHQVHICDWASQPIENFLARCPLFPRSNTLVQDFFSLSMTFDYIIEQTFLSALEPDLWTAWSKKCADLLHQGGTLAGLLFASPFDAPGPPFAAAKPQYEMLLSPYFVIKYMEISKDSIPPRAGNELFFVATKK